MPRKKPKKRATLTGRREKKLKKQKMQVRRANEDYANVERSKNAERIRKRREDRNYRQMERLQNKEYRRIRRNVSDNRRMEHTQGIEPRRKRTSNFKYRKFDQLRYNKSPDKYINNPEVKQMELSEDNKPA